MDTQVINPRALRSALGCFTTGVTVVTGRDREGNAVGMTANSFASVSLDPPLVLWSIGKRTNSYIAFSHSQHFAIHVLHAGQEDISRLFATPGADKFNAVSYDEGLGSTPLLTDYSARFECLTEHRYDGGDHTILVGRIIHFNSLEKPPLVFHGGVYKKLA